MGFLFVFFFFFLPKPVWVFGHFLLPVDVLFLCLCFFFLSSRPIMFSFSSDLYTRRPISSISCLHFTREHYQFPFDQIHVFAGSLA